MDRRDGFDVGVLMQSRLKSWMFDFFQVRSDIVSPSKHPGNQFKWPNAFFTSKLEEICHKNVLFRPNNCITYTNKPVSNESKIKLRITVFSSVMLNVKGWFNLVCRTTGDLKTRLKLIFFFFFLSSLICCKTRNTSSCQ